ncbi:hypothetical protein SM757_35355, partial [Azohydromonas lata]|nr:hypothetical protein [Azohydromonas lata]
MAVPLMEIAADEKTPILQVPGSVTVGCLMLGFALLALVTLCRLPDVWARNSEKAAEAVEPATEAPREPSGFAAAQGAQA